MNEGEDKTTAPTKRQCKCAHCAANCHSSADPSKEGTCPSASPFSGKPPSASKDPKKVQTTDERKTSTTADASSTEQPLKETKIVDEDETKIVHEDETKIVDEDETRIVDENETKIVDEDETINVDEEERKNVDEDEEKNVDEDEKKNIDETVSLKDPQEPDSSSIPRSKEAVKSVDEDEFVSTNISTSTAIAQPTTEVDNEVQTINDELIFSSIDAILTTFERLLSAMKRYFEENCPLVVEGSNRIIKEVDDFFELLKKEPLIVSSAFLFLTYYLFYFIFFCGFVYDCPC